MTPLNPNAPGFIEGNPVATFILDKAHRVVSWNRACEVLTGIPASSLIGTTEQWRAFYPSKRPVMADLILDGLNQDDLRYFYQEKFHPSTLIPGACEAEDFFPDFGNGGCWLFFTAAPIRDAEGNVIGAIETLQDFTERRKAEAALREREALLAQILQSTSVATVVIDQAHQITHWNKACEALTGQQAESAMVTRDHWRPPSPDARPFLSDLVLEGKIEDDFHRYFCGDLRQSSLIEGAFETEAYWKNLNGEDKWLYLTAAPLISSDGELIGAIETMQDVTERRLAEESLRQSEERYRELSITDELSKLYNTRHFSVMVGKEIDRAERYRRPLTLLIADVDNFKTINDTYGHAEGDRVLMALSEVIRTSLRTTDSAYRYGGEEFAVLMPEVAVQDGARLAERVRTRFAERLFEMPGQTIVHATVSIGVTQFQPGDDTKSFFCRADDGMYQAKRRGKDRVVIVEPPSGP
ncbi:MAG: diguanylate cyclase [Propionivibrio sp.]|nr:diguanylate cyclase [Propionivibrio sp.]